MHPPFQTPASVAEMTPTYDELTNLPGPAQPITVAVYGYFDQTGQYKASDTVQTLSRAVPQGGTSLLIKALQDAGNVSWFRIVERERLENLLRERQIIREMRARHDGDGNLSKTYMPRSDEHTSELQSLLRHTYPASSWKTQNK